MDFSPDVLLIDLGSVYWAAWHSSKNEEVSAAHDRSLNVVRKLREGHKHVAVCCDSPQSFRREAHPSYKAQRPEKDHASISELRRTMASLENEGLLLWEASGFEADDVIATATREATARGLRVLIASADKDLLQLVTDDVRVLSLKTWAQCDPATVFEKLGVAPRKVRDWLILVGDSSDNIQGVPGVGPKRASELLNRYGDLVTVMKHVVHGTDEVSTPKIVEALLASVEVMRVGAELVTLRSDVPIDFEQLFAERQARPLVEIQDAEWEEEETEMPNDLDEKSDTKAAASGPAASEPQSAKPTEPLPASPLPPLATTNAIVKAAPEQWELALEPTSGRAAFNLANHLWNSRLYQNYGTAEAIFAVIMRGRALGLDATTALANFHIVEGRPTMSATLIVGLILASNKAEFFELVESTNERATWATKRRGGKREITMTFDLDDAIAAGVLERTREGVIRGVSRSGRASNWDKWRRTMLRHRASVELARAVYPDITAGLYTSDEISGGTVIDADFEAA